MSDWPQIAAELDRRFVRSISTRSNGSSSLTIRAISASILGKSSSESACSISKVVVEAVGHGRPEGQLHALEQPHHRPGHHVGTGMPQQIQRLGVFAGDQTKSDLAVGGQQLADPHHLPVHLGGQRGLGQTRADLGGDVDRPNAMPVLEGFSVGQSDFEHRSPKWAFMYPPSNGCVDTKDARCWPRKAL